MTIVPNTTLNSRSDMIAAIRAMQIDQGQPVCSSIDDQSIGQQVVKLQKYLATVPDSSKPSGFRFDPAKVKSNISDISLAEAIINLQVIIATGSTGGPTAGQLSTLVRLQNANLAAVGNNPFDLPDMVSPPTVTQAATHNASLSVQANPGANRSSFWASPGTEYIRNGTGLYMGTSNFGGGTGGTNLSIFASGMVPTPLTGGDSDNGHQVAIVTSAPDVEFNLRVVGDNTQPYRFIVNGQYVARAGVAVTSAFVTLSFGSSAPRTIIVENQNGQPLLNAAVAAGNTISAPSTGIYNAPVTAIGYGDSITEAISTGTVIRQQWANWFATMCTKAGIAAFRNAGVGLTGYSNAGTGTRGKCISQMPFSINAIAYDLVAFFHGFNDYNQFPQATIVADALACWRYARLQQPNAFIEVYGIPGEATGPNVGMPPVENALAAAFASWADPFSKFIPVTTDPNGAWLTGTGRVGAPNGTGNSDIYVSSDGIHPEQPAGQVYLGGKAYTAHTAALTSFSPWILASGAWSDIGQWLDTSLWKDA